MAFFSRSSQPVPQVDLPVDSGVAPNALIGLRNIEKSYAHGTSRSYVLRRINVDVKEGEFISIMGPSGAGKSTLLHIIGMHDSAWTGDYYFGGQPVHGLSTEVVLAEPRAVVHAQNVEERRLAGAGRPHDRHELPGLDVDRHAAEHVAAAGADRIGLLEILQRNEHQLSAIATCSSTMRPSNR